jgi:16S rRNA (guanine966-N2)-methyltransferase
MRIIAGSFKNHFLASPKGLETRPTSGKMREALFNICQGYIEGAVFLDLFAGSGAMGFEALSRGAAKVVFIEKSREAVKCIQANIKNLGVEGKAQLYVGNVEVLLPRFIKTGQQFDIIFADPPYELPLSASTLKLVDEGTLLKPTGVLFIEESRGVQLESEKLSQLHLVNARKMGRSLLHQFAIAGKE